MFNGPIPGESLTREPGNAPWEQPPHFDKVDKALQFYMDKLEDDDLLDETLFILDQDFPLDLFVETLLANGEMEGYHTFDTSMLIAPVLHEHLLGLAEAAGVTVREFQGKSKSTAAKEKELRDLQIAIGKSPTDKSGVIADTKSLIDEADERLEEKTEPVDSPEEEALEKPMPRKGLMSRGG